MNIRVEEIVGEGTIKVRVVIELNTLGNTIDFSKLLNANLMIIIETQSFLPHYLGLVGSSLTFYDLKLNTGVISNKRS